MSELWRRLRILFRRDRFDRELDEEMQFHLEMQAEENRSSGISTEEARYAARRQFGNTLLLRETSADIWVWRSLDVLFQDVKYGLCILRKDPGFTTTAVLALALGIGVNTAIFSLLDGVLLRPLPYPEPERLVLVWEETPMFGLRDSPASMGNFMEWRARNRVFQDMGTLDNSSYQLTGGGTPEQVNGAIIMAGFLRALGVQPLLGRAFTQQDDQPGAAKSLLLSHSFWQQRFGGDRDVVGHTMILDNERYTIAGVMPASFRFPDALTVLWTNAGAAYSARDYANRGRHDFLVAARLKPGVSVEQANQDIKAIAAQLAREYPNDNGKIGAFVAPMWEHFVSEVREVYYILLGAAGFILLIACANVANLLLSRAANRSREFAVRMALGVGRGNIVRQLLVENLLLSGIGGGLGLLLSTQTFGFLKKLVPETASGIAAIQLDWRVLAFTLLVASGTAFLFGLAPALESARPDLNYALKKAGTRGSSGQRSRLRDILAGGEVALAIVLLIGAGLMIRTFAAVRGIDPGFRTRNLLTLSTPLAWQKYGDRAKRNAFYEQVIERIQALPGVISAGYTTGVPLVFKGYISSITPEYGGMAGVWGQTRFRLVTPRYLQTLGVPLRRGCYLDERDTATAPQVALVNETMARRFWAGQEALAKRFKNEQDGPWITVVGVVGDIHQAGLDVPPQPDMYRPYQQEGNLASGLLIRTVGDPLTIAAAAAAAAFGLSLTSQVVRFY
jgi:putative ABC transport system permease protein